MCRDSIGQRNEDGANGSAHGRRARGNCEHRAEVENRLGTCTNFTRALLLTMPSAALMLHLPSRPGLLARSTARRSPVAAAAARPASLYAAAGGRRRRVTVRDGGGGGLVRPSSAVRMPIRRASAHPPAVTNGADTGPLPCGDTRTSFVRQQFPL